MKSEKTTTHFGYEDVDVHAKQQRVNQVFERVASHYDLMNNLMSWGMHHFWKRAAISHLRLQPSHQVCEIAAGTGD